MLQEVIDTVKSGDVPKAAALLVAEWDSRLVGYAKKRLHNDADAEDAVQETFVMVCLKLASFDNCDHLEGSLFATLHYKCLEVIRERQRNHVVDTSVKPITSSEKSVEEELIDNEMRGRLNACLQRQSNTDQKLIRLSKGEGMSMEDVARLLQLSRADAYRKYNKARARILQCMSMFLENGCSEHTC